MQIKKNILSGEEYPLILAPMAELSHRGIRELIHGWGGCSVFFTEMISASGLRANSPFERYYTDFGPTPSKTIAQITGSTTEDIIRAADILLEYDITGIDINMGCSAPEIRKKGGGSAWLTREKEVLYMLRIIKNTMPQNKTLSVKLRLPAEKEMSDFAMFLQKICNSGIDFISIHPKTSKEKHDRPARWQHLKELKRFINIPLIANGNITDCSTLLSRKEEYKPEGIMIGRKAIQSPWFFSLARKRMSGDKSPFTVDIEGEGIKAIELIKRYQPPEFWLSRIKRFFLYYTKNLFWGHNLFIKIKNSSTTEEIEKHFLEYFLKNPQEKIKEEK
ncbi:tRNA-dihydrouridine synthase family protein [Spirochaetia bacterium 38H-sp]|uniref:tRNA-dihydrouridine synthase n=1 Tax=Rarispira pelagica TaxID=3141764 RepID=A0ABU9U9Y7_9SPIR